ncbi:D-malate dehydrogenase (Decarboxylating) [Operophtera brumata]|uniref:D-malate dehydrogenase (Decarboxylating) n=1 Tax=Operophtera brumata TaxID=104452 RepID=A0A0L7KXT7_OPEBR|nr:D-malate dehydrogenase (Decarboxylating) [Operophtera brumata]
MENSFNLNDITEENTYKDYYYAGLHDDNTQELEIVSEESKIKRRKSNDSMDLLFDVPTNKKRKLLSSTVSRGLQTGVND